MLAVNNKRDNICKTLSECSKNSRRDNYFHKGTHNERTAFYLHRSLLKPEHGETEAGELPVEEDGDNLRQSKERSLNVYPRSIS